MRGLLFLAPAALALQPMKPVSYDAFELAAAEALKDELRANYQSGGARAVHGPGRRRADAAQTLDQIEAALPLADGRACRPTRRRSWRRSRHDRARATEERNAVLEEINKAADCHAESATRHFRGVIDEARSLGVDASNILEKGRELAAVQGDRRERGCCFDLQRRGPRHLRPAGAAAEQGADPGYAPSWAPPRSPLWQHMLITLHN